jgi:DNA polymerase elongation subunit (family B)
MPESLYIAFDIETVPLPWESFSPSQQEFLLRGAQSEEEQQRRKAEMALSPFTAQVICLGLQLMETTGEGEWNLRKRGAYIVDPACSDGELLPDTLPEGESVYRCTERTLLEQFWKLLEKYPDAHLVSFNGRAFDAPFLMLRSALYRIRPSRNLMEGTRYRYGGHTDLLDELCFYNPQTVGATKRFNFDFYARAFGLISPKSYDLDGSRVAEYYRQGRLLEIAQYCLRDVAATWELFTIWYRYLRFEERNTRSLP